MKFLTSRVVVSAIASFIAFAIVPAIATTPEVDFKTVTSKAYVDSLISNNDISGHKVNGVALSNANITLYGRSSTGAATAAKAVKVYNSAEGDVTIGALSTGMVIVVKPTSTSTAAPTTLNVNGLGAKNMRYNGAAITTADAAKVWNKDNPSVWVYDGTYWHFAGGGRTDALPTGTANTLVTYNGTNSSTGVQQFTETAIVDAPVYTNGNLTNGDSVPSVEYVEDALVTKQPIIQPSTVNGKTQIVVKPAYGGNAGEIGYLTLDTSSLTTGNDSTVPSSKLLNTKLSEKYSLNKILDTGETNTYASDYSGAPSWATTSGTANLYRIPAAVNGDNWASQVLDAWSSKPNVPTMDTLANSLAGLYDAVGDLVDNQILDYSDTGSGLLSASVAIPSQIEYTGARTLGHGEQLFWLPQLASNGVQEATRLLKSYSTDKIAPSMDELAYALDGVLQTHETTRELQAVLNYYNLRETPLFELADLINGSDNNATLLNRSGYLQTFAPTLEALMNESYELYRLIEAKQNKLSGTNGNLVTYGAAPGQTGSKAIATSISNNANTVPNTQAVYNAVNARQIKIPQSGKVRDASGTVSIISDWTTASVKGTALPTKTGTDGVIGERKIFEAGDTYTNDAATNIQIATIGAVMENTVTKRCVGYKPGTTTQNAANCWLWEFVSNSVTCAAAGDRCNGGRDCCSGNCVNGLCSALGFDDRDGESVGSKS